MDLSFLDKSSTVTPLLVRLYDSHKLYSLAKDKKPYARVELTGVVSDLLEMDLSMKEGELIADVLIALLRQAEKDLRGALAERLSTMDSVPLRLVLQMANDEIEIAEPILRKSPVLGDLDLIYIVKSKSAEYWRKIAQRNALSEQVVELLADTRDLETAINLVENKGIVLTDYTLSILSDIAQGEETLAAPLLRRDEVTADIAGKLYQFVGQDIKQFILDNYELESQVLLDVIDDVVLDLVDIDEKSELLPTASMEKSADRFAEKGLLTVKLMLSTLKRGQVPAFIAQFAKFSGLDAKTVLEILMQPNGQGLAVACKAFDILKPDFVSIFLLTNGLRNGSSMVDTQDINRAISYYNRVTAEVAKRIMKNSLDGNSLN